jgi:hypothetical protein
MMASFGAVGLQSALPIALRHQRVADPSLRACQVILPLGQANRAR